MASKKRKRPEQNRQPLRLPMALNDGPRMQMNSGGGSSGRANAVQSIIGGSTSAARKQ
jgi:hypothetical protein